MSRGSSSWSGVGRRLRNEILFLFCVRFVVHLTEQTSRRKLDRAVQRRYRVVGRQKRRTGLPPVTGGDPQKRPEWEGGGGSRRGGGGVGAEVILYTG